MGVASPADGLERAAGRVGTEGGTDEEDPAALAAALAGVIVVGVDAGDGAGADATAEPERSHGFGGDAII